MRNAVQLTKRGIDVALSFVGLAAAAPVAAAVAVAVYFDSGAPVLFRQVRAGKLIDSDDGQLRFEEFEMLKFRTMRQDAEKGTGAVLASVGDPRVTRVGRFLRKTRLDELPQMWNVLRGDMTMVGPRPERPEILRNLALAIPLFEERMRDVKPGITGLAQVSLGYSGKPDDDAAITAHNAELTNPFDLDETEGALADEMRMKMLYDLAYVAAMERLSTYLATELLVIFKTPWVMIRGAGR